MYLAMDARIKNTYKYNRIHTYNEILFCHKKKNEILPLVTMWIPLEDIMLSEISQRKTDFTYMQN